jgi:hypothetical protein
MRIGIATDHGGFGLKEELLTQLRNTGHEVVDFGAHTLTPNDDYPDFVVPLARAVVGGKVDRGLAICGSGVGAWELFDEQDQQYQDSVLPPSVTARVTVEEASPIGWERYAGRNGVVLGMRTFGMSAPMKIVAEHFGFTPDHVATVAKEVLARCRNTQNG